MNKHNRTILGDRDALARENAELRADNEALRGIISDKDAFIAYLERQLAEIRQAARPRIANGNGTATA